MWVLFHTKQTAIRVLIRHSVTRQPHSASSDITPPTCPSVDMHTPDQQGSLGQLQSGSSAPAWSFVECASCTFPCRAAFGALACSLVLLSAHPLIIHSIVERTFAPGHGHLSDVAAVGGRSTAGAIAAGGRWQRLPATAHSSPAESATQVLRTAYCTKVLALHSSTRPAPPALRCTRSSDRRVDFRPSSCSSSSFSSLMCFPGQLTLSRRSHAQSPT